MAYFNHAFKKIFIGTHASQASVPGVSKGVDEGYLLDSGVPTVDFIDTAAPNALGIGVFGLVDPTNYQSVNAASAALTGGQPLLLVSTALYANDKIGPFHGGYQETNKSKMINPKYVRAFYRVDPCLPQNIVINIGNTPYTSGLSPSDPKCCFEFLCDQTYYLRIDVKGSPALRFLNHQDYRTIDFYTGCCPVDGTPSVVNSTNVMIGWANFIINDPYLKDFIFPVVYGEDGNIYYPPGTPGAALTWDIYDQTTAHTADTCAGLILYGAYVDTRFGDCSFQVTDFFEKEPVKILASMVDYTGDPCVFEGICVIEECCGRQGMGFGETVLRDLILAERYLQNAFHSDIRIREITQGDDLFNVITRTAQYYRYFILHSVPRFNNPTGVFDNDQYLLEIITNAPSVQFETDIQTWIEACGCNQVPFEIKDCETCEPVVPQTPD